MKKNDIFLIIGLIVVIVLGFFVMKGEKYEPSYKLPLTLSGEEGLHELSYAEYQEKIDNGDHFVVIIERTTCSYCQDYMPIAEDFAEDNGVPMYYVDTDTFSEKDWEKFEKSITFFREYGDKWGTPATLVQAGRETVYAVQGADAGGQLENIYNDYFELGDK